MLLIALLAAVGPLSAVPSPEHPYAEITAAGVAVDGDLLVRNDGDQAWKLVEVAMDVRDAQGRLVQQKLLNGNGTSPSIALVTDRALGPKGELLIFNPLASFEGGVVPARIDFRLTFEGPGEVETVVPVSVTPRPEPDRTFAFPLAGRSLVWDGHDFASHHRRWNHRHPMLKGAGYSTTAARYSFDLILVDAEGRRSTGDESVNANWTSFGAPVRAVGDGRVVALREDQPDDRRFDPATASIPNALYGNYAVLAHADGSYSMYGHLQQGSVAPIVGDFVRAGATIGRIGASGSALFPHLHFQRMDGPTDRSEGVPTRFSKVARPGGRPFARGFVDSGDVVIAD